MTLLLDVGNTRIKAALDGADGLEPAGRADHRGRPVRSVLDELAVAPGRVDRIVACCVAGATFRDELATELRRRYRLEAEFVRATRYRSPLSLVMMDIDHFKRLNDTYGHPFGDEVLRAVARTVKGKLREVDFVARYGGEELIALLPETGPREALGACERVREAIASIQLEHRTPDGSRQQVRCTASLGVASVPARSLPVMEELLRVADVCLYEAKAAGRNCVRQYQEEPPG